MPRCQALDSEGFQCSHVGVIDVNYHGDNELYSDSFSENYHISWVKIKVCTAHYEENFKR